MQNNRIWECKKASVQEKKLLVNWSFHLRNQGEMFIRTLINTFLQLIKENLFLLELNIHEQEEKITNITHGIILLIVGLLLVENIRLISGANLRCWCKILPIFLRILLVKQVLLTIGEKINCQFIREILCLLGDYG